MEQSARQRKNDQPRQRLACDRCHALKLRCRRPEPIDTSATPGDCARCLKAGSLCIYSPQARLGRPIGSMKSLSNSSYTTRETSGNAKRQASLQGVRTEPVAGDTINTTSNNPDLIMSASRPLSSSSSSSRSSRDPSIPLNHVLNDDFLSDFMQTDPKAWFNPVSLYESHHISTTAPHDVAIGPLPSPFSSRDDSVQDVSETLDSQYRLHNHNPDYYRDQHRRCQPPQQHHHHHHPQQQQQHQHQLSPALTKHYPGVPVDKCAACSIAINPGPPVLDDDASDVLNKLSSLAISIHSHSRHVYNKLRLLRTRLDRTLAVDNGIPACEPSTHEAMTAFNDCLGIQTLITTNHSLRGAIRQIKKSHREARESPPPPLIDFSFSDLPPVSNGRNTGENPDTTFSRNSISKHPDEMLRDPNACPLESPNSCRLALTLVLNCYLETLDIFVMTFNMISTTISHRRFQAPAANASAHGPNSMLDATFSIFTATQIASRLLDMVKGDMRDVWERYRCAVLATPCEQAVDASGRAPKPDPAIQMSFRRIWEKEAAIARLVESVDHRISSLMEVS